MLVLPSPKRLLLGYLLGAMLTSIALGLVIVFTLSGSSQVTSSAQHTVNPALDIALGLLILVIAFVLGTGRDTRRRARSERKRAAQVDKAPPRWKQALSGGAARTPVADGVAPTLPGAPPPPGLPHLSTEELANPCRRRRARSPPRRLLPRRAPPDQHGEPPHDRNRRHGPRLQPDHAAPAGDPRAGLRDRTCEGPGRRAALQRLAQPRRRPDRP